MTEEYKVVFLGSTFVGKTSIIRKLSGHDMSGNEMPTLTTFGTSTVQKDVDGKAYNLVFWDTAGQEQYKSISSNYYRNCNVAVLVFSIVSKDSFTCLKGIINDIETNLGYIPPIVLVGNKIDIEEWRDVSKSEVEEFYAELGYPYIETSAKEGTGMEDLLYMIIDQCKEGIPPKSPPNKVLDVSVEKPETKKGCAC